MILPSGTVTFLFTDIEGSTKLWEKYPESMRLALARHDELLRAAIEQNGGVVFKTMGDGFFAAFSYAPDALSAALTAQLSLSTEEWVELPPLRVRMALHSGVPEIRDGDYYGQPLNRVARLLAIGNGGQTLLSATTYSIGQHHLPLGVSLRDMGEHRFKDLHQPERVWQLSCASLREEFPPLRSLNVLLHNLPVQTTSFIGREKEIADIRLLMEKTRLLTLTGSGGTGKTRLCLQVAANRVDEEGASVWLVELAALSDPLLVPQAAASVLNIQEEAGRPLLEALVETLKSKKMLLLLDNCEHLLDAVAQLADAVLKNCPNVQILATSREGLGVSGEQTYRVPSLSLPPASPAGTNERTGDLLKYESVRLFADRAILIRSDFALTEKNAPTVARLCSRLDGIPFAIELAVARIGAMPVEQIESRLDNRFRLLTGGFRTALPRQQTLRALVDWSYDLLNVQEKRLLLRLSVFVGGWTLEGAERVCSDEEIEEWEVLDVLTSLVDKSLVLYEEQNGHPRYRMLETVRQYSRDKLLDAGEGGILRGRHLEFFLKLAEETDPLLFGDKSAEYLDVLARDYDNIRAAMSWSEAEQARVVDGLRLAGALARFWYLRGSIREGKEHLTRLLEKSQNVAVPLPAHAKALHVMGTLAANQGDYVSARHFFQESLTLRRKLGDSRLIAGTLHNLGYLAHEQGDFSAAQSYYAESSVLWRELGDKWGLATTLNNLARVPADQGDYAAARPLYEESLALQRELKDSHGIAMSLNNLGQAATEQGEYETASAYLEESLELRRQLKDQLGIGVSLTNLGNLCIAQGSYERAATFLREAITFLNEFGNRHYLLDALEALGALACEREKVQTAVHLYAQVESERLQMGVPRPPSGDARFARYLSTLKAGLGEAEFAATWAEGQSLSRAQLISSVLASSALYE